MLKTNQFFFSDTSTLSEVLKTLKRLNSGHLEKRKASYSISQIYMEYIKSCLILFDSMDCTTLGFPCLSLSPRQSFTVSSLSFTNSLSLCSKLCPLSQGCHLTISSSVAHFSSCPQSFPASGFFQWVSSSHQVAKVLELQLHHQSFQWIFRVDFHTLFQNRVMV